MARTKGSKNGIVKKLSYGDYKYDIGENVLHLGSLYEEYRKVEAIVTNRSTRRSQKWYMIRFGDGFEMEVKEDWINKNIIECEDVVDEN